MTLVTPDGVRRFDCPTDQFILDSVAAQGLVLPAVCRGGACSACVVKLLDGPAPDQSEQTYLTEADVQSGFVLLCVASPLGDCTFQTHQTAEYLASLEG